MIGMVVVRTKTGQFRNGLSRQSEREHKMSSPRYFVAVFLSCGIFAGIWPVSAQATDYPRWVTTLDELLHGSSPDELHRVYVRNAESFYRV